jgi:hypothetical protein
MNIVDRIKLYMKANELKVYVPLKLCFILIQKVKGGSRLNYLLILLFKEGELQPIAKRDKTSDKRPHKYFVK